MGNIMKSIFLTTDLYEFLKVFIIKIFDIVYNNLKYN